MCQISRQFFSKKITPWLSSNIIPSFVTQLSSLKNLCISSIYFPAKAIAVYLAPQLLSAMDVCVLDDQLTIVLPIEVSIPLILFRSSLLGAKLVSIIFPTLNSFSFRKHNCVFVQCHFKYLTALSTTFQRFLPGLEKCPASSIAGFPPLIHSLVTRYIIFPTME